MEQKYILRSQIQVEASPHLKRAIKQIALDQNKSLKEVVLIALAKQYPKLKSQVDNDLGRLAD